MSPPIDDNPAAAVPPLPDAETGIVEPNAAVAYLGRGAMAGKLCVLAGGGASASAGLEVWEHLGTRLRGALGKKQDRSDNVLQLASMYVDDQYKSLLDRSAAKNRLIVLIESLLYSTRSPREDPFGKIYPRLRELPVSNYYTTNWDQLFYQCLIQDADLPVERYDNRTLRYHPAPATSGSRHLVYLHGTIPGDPDQTIATSDECYQFEWLAKAAFERLVAQFESETVLLAVGYSLTEINVLTYLKKARVRGHPASRIYALMPPLPPRAARELWQVHDIFPVTLGLPGIAQEAAACAFLDALLRAARGEAAEISMPAESPRRGGASPALSGAAEATEQSTEEIIQAVERKMFSAGFQSPADWFPSWPGRDHLQPVLPPTHALLNTVYVERGLKSSLIEGIKSGRHAGISGLLGIGGVGKSFLAMKIAQELSQEGWAVVWVALLDQSAEEAMNILAAAYRLRFADNLRLDEKIVALRVLFEQVVGGGRRTLVILDNAERFPDLPLLLKALECVPILVTSRTEECNDVVRYQRIESMTEEQAAKLCRLYLNEYGSGHYDHRLREADREDLKRLCRHLGGHPLGIRLVLAGFVRRLAHRRFEERPFRVILEEITSEGLAVIPPARELGGRAGETLHRTIFSTFEWLYRDLPEISPQFGPQAVQLLPVISALGSMEIGRRSISAALSHITTRIETALDPSRAQAEQQRLLQQAPASVPASAPASAPSAAAPSLLTVGSFGLERLSKPAARIEIPAHQLDFNEEQFLTLLGGSISLTKNEKRRVLLAVPKLSQYQIDELIRILKEEKRKFCDLDVKHYAQLRALEQRHAREWEELGREMAATAPETAPPASSDPPAPSPAPAADQSPAGRALKPAAPNRPLPSSPERKAATGSENPLSTILDPNPPPDLIPQVPKAAIAPAAIAPGEEKEMPSWFQALKALRDDADLDQALGVLISVSLIEASEQADRVGVHPLVREFSFEERNRASSEPGATAVPDLVQHGLLTASGPSLEAVFEGALSVLSPSQQHGDSFLDLLPRLKGRRSLADQACRKILNGRAMLHKLGEWELLKQLCEEGAALAEDAGLKETEGILRCELGELMHRMEYAEGVPTLRRGCDLLEAHGGRRSYYRSRWAGAYLSACDCEVEMASHARQALESLRALMSDVAGAGYYDTINSIEDHLREHLSEGTAGPQMGLSSAGNNWLTNAILDLSAWFDLQLGHGLTARQYECCERLYELARTRAEESKSWEVSVSPQRHVELRFDLLVGQDLLERLSDDDLERKFHQIRKVARNAGIRGMSLLSDYHYHCWRRNILAGQWQKITAFAEKYLESTASGTPSNRASELLKPRLILVISRSLAVRKAAESEDLRAELRRIEEKSREWGRNELLGWLLLARGLLAADPIDPDRRAATRALVQARRAFGRQLGAVPPEAEALYRRALERVDTDGPRFEILRDSLSAEEQAPADFRPWLARRRDPLPERVRSKRDGRTMRLIRGGLQTGPFGGEAWLYDFYCDEQPVTADGFESFLAAEGTSGRRLTAADRQGRWAAGMDPAAARSYAAWAGKRLPSAYEWFATKWQLAAGNSPEAWNDWPTASERMLARIEMAIRGQVWEEHALLPAQMRTLPTDVPPAWLKNEIARALSGDWLLRDPELHEPFRELVHTLLPAESAAAGSEPDRPETLSRQQAESLVKRLAAAPSLSLGDKKKILAKRHLSAEEAQELLEALEQDARNLEGKQAHRRVAAARESFTEWLTDSTPELSPEALGDFISGAWLNAAELAELFERGVLRALTSPGQAAKLSAAEARELALGLACSLSLKLPEKERILQTAGELSRYQLHEILAMLRAGGEKLLRGAGQNAERLRFPVTRCANEFLRWLVEDGDQTAFYCQDRLIGVWSGVHVQEGRSPLVCRGNPLADRLWLRQGVVSSDMVDHRGVGIRCVLPVFTAPDLDAVEEL